MLRRDRLANPAHHRRPCAMSNKTKRDSPLVQSVLALDNYLTDEDRAKLTSNIPGFEAQLALLIEELENLRKSARNCRMKALEKKAESLVQRFKPCEEAAQSQPQINSYKTTTSISRREVTRIETSVIHCRRGFDGPSIHLQIE